MHMGYYAANNIHQQMQKELGGKEPAFLELGEIPPMIGLALGKKAVAYWPEGGLISGEEVLKDFFNDDLGFSSEYFYLRGDSERCADVAGLVCWNHLRLGEEPKL